ncbi:MAG TPA: hypothetical protein VFL83_05475 [Anaeromyxobacter sp.]|nr:hypothetical protein [Anaeromyxobacter sp.]
MISPSRSLAAAAAALASSAIAADPTPPPRAAADPAPQARAAPAGAKAAFEKLKALSGSWEGKAGHGEKLGPAAARWETISAGTAVMETLFPGTDHEMRSVYFLDGGDLVLTHYCAMGNQPRMRLSPASTDRELVFDFAGGTNLDPARDVHVHSGRLKLVGPDALEAEWSVWGGGKQTGANRFVLERKRT